MNRIAKTIALGLICIAGAAAAKDGVTNPVVKARMDTMGAVRGNVAILGDMASGKTVYDQAAATAAQAALAAAAAEVTAKFQPQETDPVSEAKPEIWTSWDDFATKADALAKAAVALDASSLDGVKTGMGAVGGTCKACHSVYRL
ncbi:MAG: cytochrome c [Gemmobacter sp.]|nr:cytochrome c [Gemmobacter sp.]